MGQLPSRVQGPAPYLVEPRAGRGAGCHHPRRARLRPCTVRGHRRDGNRAAAERPAVAGHPRHRRRHLDWLRTRGRGGASTAGPRCAAPPSTRRHGSPGGGNRRCPHRLAALDRHPARGRAFRECRHPPGRCDFRRGRSHRHRRDDAAPAAPGGAMEPTDVPTSALSGCLLPGCGDRRRTLGGSSDGDERRFEILLPAVFPSGHRRGAPRSRRCLSRPGRHTARAGRAAPFPRLRRWHLSSSRH